MEWKKSVESMPPLTSYTWLVRKQFDWCGGMEYSIELKELEGCVSYGYTIAEAKKGLLDSVKVWLNGHNNTLPAAKNETHIIVIEPDMHKEEFDYINHSLQQLKETIEVTQ
ncbi:type II toxin-antitoxin system HicB family antitoxin [Anaerobacillus sp. MEB173]|uniref:type II toxin-antitoxin system HicB family antitoxin n=1 Tax=Anaerobacillus sp. MEB173 TaxID=3383345 RepID=UPI003F8F821C